MYAGKDADIQEVADGLGHRGPTILFVCCHGGVAAIDMQIALIKIALDETRVDGGMLECVAK